MTNNRCSRIAVIGAGYVGLSYAIALAQEHSVNLFDIDDNKIKLIEQRQSPIKNKIIEDFLAKEKLNLHIKNSLIEVIKNVDFIFICISTDYYKEKATLNTIALEEVCKTINKMAPKSIVIIKSTVPIGFTKKLVHDYNINNIIFSPEFLKEDTSLTDVLNPSRVVVGCMSEFSLQSKKYIELIRSLTHKDDLNILITSYDEAEAIKLFSNAYLAMRIAFFNELDSFAEYNNMSSKKVIEGVSYDKRIGDHYNNPSFGFGGYCLPKDSMQLKKDCAELKLPLISAIPDSNNRKMSIIIDRILHQNVKTVGIYRLSMKSNSDNIKNSSVIVVANELLKRGIEVIVYEPIITIRQKNHGFEFIDSIEDFKYRSDIVLSNRVDNDISDIMDKVYTRDIYHNN